MISVCLRCSSFILPQLIRSPLWYAISRPRPCRHCGSVPTKWTLPSVRCSMHWPVGDQARSVFSSWPSCAVTRYPFLYWNSQRDHVRIGATAVGSAAILSVATACTGARADGGFAGSVGSSAAYYAADSLAYDSCRAPTHKHTKPVDRGQPQAV